MKELLWDRILFEAKAVEKLTDGHIKQVLNYLAASKLRVGLVVNFGGDSLEWKGGHSIKCVLKTRAELDTNCTDSHDLRMKEMLYKEEVFQLVGFCMEIHRELGRGHDEIIYKDGLVVELSRARIPFSREKNYEVVYKGVVLPHYYYADFVIWDRILFEAKAVEKLTDGHIKQVLNYLAASKLRVGLVVNFGGESLEWKRVIL